LFGNTLKTKSGEVDTSTALSGKTVGIYFSAHWCPPCRGFTPKLAEFYNKHKESKNFEVVFVSGDSDIEQFEEYYNEMPWLAVSYGSEYIDKLNDKYQIRGIPNLVILNSEGEVITRKGRQQVMSDPNANSFPWKPKSFSQIIGGPLIKSNKDYSETIQYSDLKGKVIGIYFSAHWCPPCRQFTPLLAEFYTKNKEKKQL
jgi:nucleoredoxin